MSDQFAASSESADRSLGAGRNGQIPASLQEVELFANADDTKLLLSLFRLGETAKPEAGLESFTSQLRAALPELETIALFAERQHHRKNQEPEDEKPQVLAGSGFLTYAVSGHSYQVSAGAFSKATVTSSQLWSKSSPKTSPETLHSTSTLEAACFPSRWQRNFRASSPWNRPQLPSAICVATCRQTRKQCDQRQRHICRMPARSCDPT